MNTACDAQTHDPIDLVAFMLGTNDLKARPGLTLDDITKGMRRLINIVHSPGMWNLRAAPRVLVIAPMHLCGETLAHFAVRGNIQRALGRPVPQAWRSVRGPVCG